jgi:hypothetical protein
MLLSCGQTLESLGRQCSSGNADACARLVETATTDLDLSARSRALEALHDQKTLAEMAKTETVARGPWMAVIEKLTDQALLADVAVTATARHVGKAAVRKLVDQSSLATVAVESEDWATHSLAVERLTDEGLRIVRARYGGFPENPEEFIRQHPRALLVVVETRLPEGWDSSVIPDWMTDLLGTTQTAAPVEAVVKIRLRGKALSARYSGADQRLPTGGELSGDVCLEWQGRPLKCRKVYRKIDPPSLIEKRHRTEEYRPPVSMLLEDLLVEDLIPFVQELNGMEAAEFLASIALRTRDRRLCETVLRQIADQELLVDIATRATTEPTRRQAIYRLDQPTLASLASGDEDPAVRMAAVQRLADDTLLATLARSDPSTEVPEAANKRLEDLREYREKYSRP